jgi:intracellular septation protein A
MTDLVLETTPAPPARRQLHPLIHAGRWILADLLSTLAFVGLYALTHSVLVATSLAVGAGVLQIAWLALRRKPIDAMQWMSLGLVVVFGSASLLTHDPRFVMLKPSLIYGAVGVVMLKPGWLNRYMPEVALTWGADLAFAFGYVWALLMFATAGLNLALVARGDPRLWAEFLAVFPIGSKIVLVLVQYAVMRTVLRGRARAARR